MLTEEVATLDASEFVMMQRALQELLKAQQRQADPYVQTQLQRAVARIQRYTEMRWLLMGLALGESTQLDRYCAAKPDPSDTTELMLDLAKVPIDLGWLSELLERQSAVKLDMRYVRCLVIGGLQGSGVDGDVQGCGVCGFGEPCREVGSLGAVIGGRWDSHLIVLRIEAQAGISECDAQQQVSIGCLAELLACFAEEGAPLSCRTSETCMGHQGIAEHDHKGVFRLCDGGGKMLSPSTISPTALRMLLTFRQSITIPRGILLRG